MAGLAPDERLDGTAVLVATDAMMVENGLYLMREAESARRSIERLQRLQPRLHRQAETVIARGRGGVLVFVAADAGRVLARLQRAPTAHRLHRAATLVQRLEIHGLSRGHGEQLRAILIHLRLAEDRFEIPSPVANGDGRAGERAAGRAVAVIEADPRHAEFERHHAQLPDRPARHPGQPGTCVNILHIERAGGLVVINSVSPHQRSRARRQGHGLVARQARVGGQQFAVACEVYPVNAEIRIALPPLGLVPPQRRVSSQKFLLVQGIGILPKLAHLPVGVGVLRRRVTHGRDKLNPGALLPAPGRVNDRQLAGLRRVVATENGEHLLRAGNAARMGDGGGRPGIVAVELRLPRAVGVHLKERLHEDLAPVVVVPARVNHAAIVQHLRIDRMHLVEPETPEVAAIPVAGVKVARLCPEATNGLNAARRGEDDVVVRQVSGLVIGEAQARRDLAHEVGGHIQLVEMVVVLIKRLLPREEHALTIPRHRRIADCARGIGHEGTHLAVKPFHLQHAQLRVRQEMAFILRVR